MKEWPKFKTRCARCGDVCIVKPLFPTTKEERETMVREYVCADCAWSPASGHPGGWRVTRRTDGLLEELETCNGRRVLFKTYEAAQRRADKLNREEATA